jgi:signal transduction histidine kinase
MGRSVRSRITLSAVCVMTIAVAIASVALVTLLRQSLLGNVDAHAKLRLQDVAALAAAGQLPTALAGDDEDGTVAQVVSGHRVLVHSPVVRGDRPLADFVPAGSDVGVRTADNTAVADGAPQYRVAARLVNTPFGLVTVYAAASLEPVSDSIHSLEALLAVVGPALVLLVGGMTWWFVGRTLRPVEAIRRQVAAISATDLDRRVPEPRTADEIQRLALTMNTMLERLEHAVKRQRAFVSDAAHELRSPLAAIRAELELATTRHNIDDWPTVIDRLRHCTRRMERLVEDLLLLATTDEEGPPRRTDVDLDEVLMAQLENLRATTRRTVDVHRVDAARVLGDSDQLERVITNLLDNAERHAVRAIAVDLSVTEHTAELVIADDGPGVPAEYRQRIFDRFSRLDKARDRGHGGAGLGLAIVRRVVEDHGGSIELADTPAGATFVIRLRLRGPECANLNDGRRASP